MSIKKYYFPYATFNKPMVYQYADRKDSTSTTYWVFQTVADKGDTVMVTMIYDANFKPNIVYKNILSKDGSSLYEMKINRGDSLGMVKCEIKDKQVFGWKIKPNDKLIVSFNIGKSVDEKSENIVTERSFEPNKQMVDYNGKEYECLVTKDVILINRTTINRTISEEQQRTSYFAEGIGLIQFETFKPEGGSTLFSLRRIMTLEEWSKMALTQTSSPTSSTDSSNTSTQ